MAILSKILDGDDMKQLTITETFSFEPFLAAKRDGMMKVKDEKEYTWKFDYKVKTKGTRVTRIISGPHWGQFLANNGVQVGQKVEIHHKDGWCSQADYKIVVTNTGS